MWPYPAQPVTYFPAGTKTLSIYAPFNGMTSQRQVRELLFVDGKEALDKGTQPWADLVKENGYLGSGVYTNKYFMKLGGDLPTGHWEVRIHVDEVLVARGFFSVSVDTRAAAGAA